MQAAAIAAELEVKLQYIHTGLDSEMVAKQYELDRSRTEMELRTILNDQFTNLLYSSKCESY